MERGGERGRGGWKIGFWNVAGLGNKDKNFWEEIGRWEVVVLLETWVEKKGWEKIKEKLPRGFKWEMQPATRRNKRGRAMGGMIMGIKREMVDREKEIDIDEEGLIRGSVKVKGEKWRIIGVYVNGDMEEKLERMKDWMDEKKEGTWMIVGGDFNARTGTGGGGVTRGGKRKEGKVENQRMKG